MNGPIKKSARQMLFLLLLCLKTGSVHAALDFLNVGMGSRALALGEAYVGQADDFSGPYWNPAGPAFLSSPLAGFFHSFYYEEMDFNFVSILVPVPSAGVFGLCFTHTGSDIPLTQMDASGSLVEPGGTYSCYDMDFILSYSRKIGKDISAGISVKYIYSKIEEEHAGTMNLDAGIRVIGFLHRRVNAGLVLLNIGPGIRYIDAREAQPSSVKAGCSAEFWRMIETGVRIRFFNDYALLFKGIFSVRLALRYLSRKYQKHPGH
ncbi:MAG: PorV/PorQ family protein [bacterium]|nr:PorV/PorQ family protein [bacterium]